MLVHHHGNGQTVVTNAIVWADPRVTIDCCTSQLPVVVPTMTWCIMYVYIRTYDGKHTSNGYIFLSEYTMARIGLSRWSNF